MRKRLDLFLFHGYKRNDRYNYKKKTCFIAVIFILAIVFFTGWIFLRDISTKFAVSDACDYVTRVINNTVNSTVSINNYNYDYFVTLVKNDYGQIVAAECNMARLNSLATDILDEILNYAESGIMTVTVPLGNLTGLNLLMGRGPAIPIEIVYLTSSEASIENNIVSAGINQTKHQLELKITVDVEILIPWSSASAEIVSKMLIADTIIVGQVPDTYVNVG